MSAIKIIELLSENVLHLNIDEFAKIIEQPDVSDRSLVIISIAGAMRKGKSFLLNFFLMYAYEKYTTTKTISIPNTFKKGCWIDGFSHCSGSERHTTGIQVWPDIFLHEDMGGKKIAIIIMDTQGTFDNETKFSDCVGIFALSTLLSSVLIYNISHNIQIDQLEYLGLFVEYAKLTLDKISPTADIQFDTLQLLVRDWNFPYQAEYGFEGGKQILEKTFSSTSPEVQKTIIGLKNIFKKIECFLMPFPGDVIAKSKKFDGNLEKIDKSFLENIALLTTQLFSPECLKIKKINGIELKGSNFVNLIRRSFEILNNHENIPKPKTIAAVTADNQNFKLIADAVNLYKKLMSDELVRKQYMENDEFMKLNEKNYNESIVFYKKADKFELLDEESDRKWLAHLEDELVRECNYYLILNEKKQPNNSKELEHFITVVTEQKDLIKVLNERHAQNMLNLIKTFREREEENREHIAELTRSFQRSPQEGFKLMDIVTKVVDIIPNTITAISKGIRSFVGFFSGRM